MRLHLGEDALIGARTTVPSPDAPIFKGFCHPSFNSPTILCNMSGDKAFMAHELDLDPNGQDDRDMERLGKAQQFKVGAQLCGDREKIPRS